MLVCMEIRDIITIFFRYSTLFTIRSKLGFEISESRLQYIRAKLIGDTFIHDIIKTELFLETIETGWKSYEIILI